MLSIIHTESSLGWGGQEIRVLRESQAFQRLGYNVKLIAPAEAEISKRAKEFDVSVITLPIFNRDLVAFRCLRRTIKQLQPAIINTHSSTDSWLTAAVCLSLRRPPKVVRTRHICAQPSRSRITRWLYGHAAQKVVTTGGAIRQQIISLGINPDHVVSIPTGINPESYPPGSKSDAKERLGLGGLTVIGVVATIRSWKGHRVLIEALKHLPASQYKLIFVGDGPIRLELEMEIKEKGLQDLVLFAGEQKEVISWLHAMDVFVLPSYANEGISQALIQAMMAEIPVVTTSAGAIEEVALDCQTALVVEPNKSEPLRAAITLLLEDRALAEKLAMNARAFVLAKHTEAIMVRQMIDVFENLVCT